MDTYYDMTHQELAANHHYNELNATGETTFISDVEDRTVSMNDITADCLVEISMTADIHNQTEQGVDFVMALRELIRAKRHELMDEALEDYYGV